MKTFYTLIGSIALLILISFSRCSMVFAQDMISDSLFESISQPDPIHARTGNKVLRINSQSSSKVGYQRLVPINAGQQISTEVYAYYEKRRSRKFLKTLLSATGGIVAVQAQQAPFQAPPEQFNVGKRSFPLVGAGIAFAPATLKGIFKNVPESFLQYNFYNKDSTFVGSVYQFITKKARDQWQLLSLKEIAKQDGFVEIKIVNRDEQNVWFDDLTIIMPPVYELNATGPTPNVADPPVDPNTSNLYRVYIRSFAPPGSFDGFGFRDDNRGFTTNENVTSRIKQRYEIIPDGASPLIGGGIPVSDPSYTTAGDFSASGDPIGEATITSYERSGVNNICRVYTHYEGSNPFTTTAGPDIEVESRMTITENFNKSMLTLALTLNSKHFPALEMFIEDTGGRRVFLAVDAAYGTPASLVTRSVNEHTVTAIITINISHDGQFQSVYNTGQYNNTKSISYWNSGFSSQAPGPF